MTVTSHDNHLPLHQLPTLQSGVGLGFLSDVRVVDLTTSIAGPYATTLLADFGAGVIKIERPEGDDARHWGPPFLDGEGLWFLAVNRNKKSVVLDLTTDAGMKALVTLIATADVVVTNQLPRVQKKLGLDYDRLKTIKNDLIVTTITGFGLSGERADLTCYDLIAEGFSGIMDVTGAAGGDPQKIGAPAADMLAGQDAAMATIAALYDRQRTGKGRLIDVSLVDSMTRFLACRLSAYLGSGDVPTRSGGTDSVIAIYQAFDTADDPITLGLGSNGIWQRFWSAVGKPDYAKNEQMQTNAARRARRENIVEDIQTILLSRTRTEWLAIFAEARIPAGPINRLDETAADPALIARGLLAAVQDDGRLTPHVGLGIQFDGQAVMPRSVAPRLGAHTEEILATLPETDQPSTAPNTVAVGDHPSSTAMDSR